MGIFSATERRPFTGDGAGEEANMQKRRVGVRGARAQHLLQETGLQQRKGEQQKPQNETQTEQHNKHTQTPTQTRPQTQQKQTRTHTHTNTHTHTHTHTQSASAPHARELPKYFRKRACTNSWGDPPGKHKAYTHVKAKHRAKHTNACDRCGPKAGDKSTGGTAECKTWAGRRQRAERQCETETGRTAPPGPMIYAKAGAAEQKS